jgi:hypothetical protein
LEFLISFVCGKLATQASGAQLSLTLNIRALK